MLLPANMKFAAVPVGAIVERRGRRWVVKNIPNDVGKARLGLREEVGSGTFFPKNEEYVRVLALPPGCL